MSSDRGTICRVGELVCAGMIGYEMTWNYVKPCRVNYWNGAKMGTMGAIRYAKPRKRAERSTKWMALVKCCHILRRSTSQRCRTGQRLDGLRNRTPWATGAKCASPGTENLMHPRHMLMHLTHSLHWFGVQNPTLKALLMLHLLSPVLRANIASLRGVTPERETVGTRPPKPPLFHQTFWNKQHSAEGRNTLILECKS